MPFPPPKFEVLRGTDRSSVRSLKGGVYLVAADESEEFEVALRHAADIARAEGGTVSIVYVTPSGDVQEWGLVEERMRRETRRHAETFLWTVAKKLYETRGIIPILSVAEGSRTERLIEAVNADPAVRMLVLGAQTGAGGPGPLVAYFTGKGLARLRVPVLLVPEHLELQAEPDLG